MTQSLSATSVQGIIASALLQARLADAQAALAEGRQCCGQCDSAASAVAAAIEGQEVNGESVIVLQHATASAHVCVHALSRQITVLTAAAEAAASKEAEGLIGDMHITKQRLLTFIAELRDCSLQLMALKHTSAPSSPVHQAVVPEVDLSDTKAALADLDQRTRQCTQDIQGHEEMLQSHSSSIQELKSGVSAVQEGVQKAADEARAAREALLSDLMARLESLQRGIDDAKDAAAKALAKKPAVVTAAGETIVQQPGVDPEAFEDLEQRLQLLMASVSERFGSVTRKMGTLAATADLQALEERVHALEDLAATLASGAGLEQALERLSLVEARPLRWTVEELREIFMPKDDEESALQAAFKVFVNESVTGVHLDVTEADTAVLAHGTATLAKVHATAVSSRASSRPSSAAVGMQGDDGAVGEDGEVAPNSQDEGEAHPLTPTEAAIASAASILAMHMQRQVKTAERVDGMTYPDIDAPPRPQPGQPITPAQFLASQQATGPRQNIGTMLVGLTAQASQRANGAAGAVAGTVTPESAQEEVASAAEAFSAAVTEKVTELLELADLRQAIADEDADSQPIIVDPTAQQDSAGDSTALGRIRCVACDRPTSTMQGQRFPMPAPDEATRRPRTATLLHDSAWGAGQGVEHVALGASTSTGGGFRHDPAPYILPSSMPQAGQVAASSASTELIQRYKTAAALRDARSTINLGEAAIPSSHRAKSPGRVPGGMPPGKIKRMASAPGQLGMTVQQSQSAASHGWTTKQQPSVTVAPGVRPGVGGYRPLLPQLTSDPLPPIGTAPSIAAGVPASILLGASGDAARSAAAHKAPGSSVAAAVAGGAALATAAGWEAGGM